MSMRTNRETGGIFSTGESAIDAAVRNMQGIHISDITGPALKKHLGVRVAVKRYHNKHKDGSGNFGFTLYKGEQCYDLAGSYDSTGKVYSLQFGTCSRIFGDVTTESCPAACAQVASMIARHSAIGR
jgi:hypothetical protein